MKLFRIFIAAVMSLSLAGGALADEKANKQAEVRKAAQTTMAKFYKADPTLKTTVAKAPGYAVFTTFGMSFVIGGGGGKGIVHNNKTKKDTYMNAAQASAGLQIGIAESETLIVFKDAAGMEDFIKNGWTAGGGGGAQVGAGGNSSGQAAGDMSTAHAQLYTLTKNGIRVGVAAEGSKFWLDSDLN